MVLAVDRSLAIAFGLLALVLGLVFGALSGTLAEKKGHSYSAYFALGFFLGFIGLFVAAAVPRAEKPNDKGSWEPWEPETTKSRSMPKTESWWTEESNEDQSARGGVSAPTQTDPTDVVDQLERLAALRDRGVITEEQFSAQRDKLLS
jgi:hypothetical protein